MGGRFMALYCFIPLEKRPSSDEEIFALLGCDLKTGIFGPLGITWHGTQTLSDHVCAQVSFLYREFSNAFDATPGRAEVPLEEDPMLPLARAIRHGAARAKAEVAFLETRNYMMETVYERYWMVLTRDPDILAGEWYSLLYMEDDMVRDWHPNPRLLERDELPGGPGRTLFASRGDMRWF